MKKFRKILALVLVALLAVSLLAGCSSDNSSGSDNKTVAKTKPVIDINGGAACKMAYIPMGAGQEDFPVILKGMQEAIALYPNITLDTYDPGFNPTVFPRNSRAASRRTERVSSSSCTLASMVASTRRSSFQMAGI